MSLIAVTSSQGFSVLPSSALRASHPDPAPTITTALTPPSRIPSPCISWSPDASTIYVASGGSVSAYNPSGSFIRDVVREGEGGIGGAKLGTMVVLQTQSGTDPVLAFSRGARAVVFDSETRRALQTVEGHRSSITTMSLAQDQSLLATSSGETTVITNLVQQTNTVLRNAPPGVVAVAFHPAKRSTLLILSPRGLHVFDTAKGNAPTRTIPIGKAEGGAGYIAFSPITPALVAVLVPGSGTRVLMLDIEKESSLVKKFTVEENVSAMSFSHDGGSIIVGTEVGRVLQLNLRSMDKPAQAVAVDPTRGRIGGLSLAVGPTPLARTMSSSTATTAPVTGTRPLTRPTRAESVTSTSTGESVRVRSSVDPRTPAIKLRSKPSVDVLAKSPDALRGTTTKTPETLRKRASSADLLGKTSLAPKTSPGALRVKAGVESKPRPTSMIVATSARERTGTRVRPVSVVEEKSGDVAGKSSRGANASPVAVASAIGESPMRDKSEKECESTGLTPGRLCQTQLNPFSHGHSNPPAPDPNDAPPAYHRWSCPSKPSPGFRTRRSRHVPAHSFSFDELQRGTRITCRAPLSWSNSIIRYAESKYWHTYQCETCPRFNDSELYARSRSGNGESGWDNYAELLTGRAGWGSRYSRTGQGTASQSAK
ncbi:hypothetical protein FRC08_008456 [Ceratobasidium sp. 394]|nr:hypothetical protein FRC08_008456 [Ceratobasidium sp. 394]